MLNCSLCHQEGLKTRDKQIEDGTLCIISLLFNVSFVFALNLIKSSDRPQNEKKSSSTFATCSPPPIILRYLHTLFDAVIKVTKASKQTRPTLN